METTTFIALIAIIISIIAIFYPSMERRFSTRPKLDVELQYRGGGSSPRGTSNRNPYTEEIINGRLTRVINGNNRLQHFEVNWDYEIILRNTSEYTAYFPKITYAVDSVRFNSIELLNSNKPIDKGSEVILKAKIVRWEECRGTERTHPSKEIPEELRKLNLVIHYQNQFSAGFYTHFSLIGGIPQNNSGRI